MGKPKDRLSTRISKYRIQNEIGRKLNNAMGKKYMSKKVIQQAAGILKIMDKKTGTLVFDSQMDQLYLMDFALHEIKFPVSDRVRQSFQKRGISIDQDRINIIQRYKLTSKFDPDSLENEILDGMINSTMTILEVDADPPEIVYADLLNDRKEVRIINFNLSKDILTGMIVGTRLKTIQSLTTTSGILFLFDNSLKDHLLESWQKYREYRPNISFNALLYHFLYHKNREMGLETTSELFIE